MDYQTITIDGHRIGYREHNADASNTPIIYIHGILNSLDNQDAPLREILAGQRWIALNLPGHAPAKLADNFQLEDFTPQFIAHTLAKAIRQIVGDSSVRLIGHSTGGFSSLAIAHEAPDLVESICLVDAFAQGKWHSVALRPSQLLANLPILSKSIFCNYMRFSQGNVPIIHIFYYGISHDYRAVRQTPQYETSFRVAVEGSRNLHPPDLYPYFHHMPRINILPWLTEITAPVTIIHGDNDPVILPRHAQAMHDALSNSTMIWLKNCGHDPFTEAFDDLKHHIQAWLT